MTNDAQGDKPGRHGQLLHLVSGQIQVRRAEKWAERLAISIYTRGKECVTMLL